MFVPPWVKEERQQKEWENWKTNHLNWEAVAASNGWTEPSVEAWVKGGDSKYLVPNGCLISNYHVDRFGGVIYQFKQSGEETMQFGTGILYLERGGNVDGGDQLTLKDANDNFVWGMPITFVHEELKDHLTIDLLREAWFIGAMDWVDFCARDQVPLIDLYAEDLVDFRQVVSRAAWDVVRRTGMKPVDSAINIEWETVDVGGTAAVIRPKVTCEFENKQTPSVTYSQHGNIPNLIIW